MEGNVNSVASSTRRSTLTAARTIQGLLAVAAAFAMILAATSGASAAVQEQLRVPVAGDVFEDICGHTLIHTDGHLHIVISFTINDNRVSGFGHFNPQGAKIVDETGQVYNGTGVGQYRFNEPLENGAVSITNIDSFKLIATGGATSFRVQATIHTTINANGEVTASVENMSVTCR